MVTKYTYEFVKESFEEEGYTLLSEKYINNNTKMFYICSNGHEHSIRWSDWQQGHRCLECSGNLKPSYELVKDSFEKEGYILLTKEYKNRSTKLNYICPSAHKHKVTWSNWKRGTRCPTCYLLSKYGKTNSSWAGGVTKDKVPLYKTYHPQLSLTEKTRLHIDEKGRNLLEVSCAKCSNWFVPNRSDVSNRLCALDGKIKGEHRLYCSQSCKNSCEVYGKRAVDYLDLTPKELPYTPEELQIWSQEVLSRANYICEICGQKAEHAHHIQPKKLAPILALDPENGLALCKDCHYKYGHADECSTTNLASIVCKNY